MQLYSSPHSSSKGESVPICRLFVRDESKTRYDHYLCCSLQVSELVYVHSKMMIVDDKTVIIGSGTV